MPPQPLPPAWRLSGDPTASRATPARRAASALAAVLLLCTAAAPASFADEAPGAGKDSWSAAPAGNGSRAAHDGRPSFYAEGAPGTVLEDEVAVTNTAEEPRTVTLRGADADNARDGSYELSAADRTRGTGAWLTFADRKITVPPRTRAQVPFTVRVPAGAVPGDHPGAIVVSSGGRDVGVQLRLRVSGPTLSALTVERVRLSDRGISYDLVNRGNTVLNPKLAVRADGVLGEVLRRAPRTLPVELLPGRRASLTEPWADRPAFDSVDIRLTATAGGGARDTATGSARLVPWWPLAGTAAVLLGAPAALLVLGRARRARRAALRTDPEGPGGGAEDLRTEEDLSTDEFRGEEEYRAGADDRAGPAREPRRDGTPAGMATGEGL